MADLSNIKARPTEQDRITERRDAMFSRRNTEAPAVRSYQNMRNATRGDGGAAELLNALGMAKNAASDFQSYQDNKAAKTRETDQADAFIDEATGMVDEARMQKSKAYREGALMSRTQAEWATKLPDLESGLQELLQNQTDPDPAKREAEVAHYLETFNRTFAVGEDGELRDFGSPGANRWLAEQMAGLRGNAMSRASQLIDKRMGEESMSNMSAAVRGQIVAGQDVNWDQALGMLLPSVDRKAGVVELISSVKGAVGQLEETDPVRGRRILDGLLGWAKQPAAGAPEAPKPFIAGNLAEDIRYRVKNDDGSVSTVRTMSIGTDQGEVLIPTVVGGKVVSDEAAIAHYRKTGENFGTFKTPEEATAYAEALHQRHAAQLQAEASKVPSGLMEPFAGFTTVKRTGKMGDARTGGSSHNGEDFPVPVGTAIVAPTGGEVISSMRNARGGNQVRVKLDNGDIVGFAHLSSREVQVGQRVEAGAQLGLSGNTGKSTGPHVHMTVEVGGKKVSPSGYFSEQPKGSTGFAEAFAPTSPPSPPLPSEEANEAGGVQLTPPTGNLTLSADQVLDLQEYRRTYNNRIDARVDRQRTETQSKTSAEYLSRLAGIGAYPTVTEVRDAIRGGAINPQQGTQLLNIIDSDRRQKISDARQAASWAREDERVGKEDRLQGKLGSILGPIYAGRSTVMDGTSRLLALASAETDPEVRQALLREGSSELGTIQSLRLKGPEYQSADTDLNSWESTYTSQLGKVRLPRGMDTQSAKALIRQKMDTFRTELGRGNWSPDRVPTFMNSAERRLDAWFQETFPPRPKPASK
ncbi:M23 family metallopeptidase [Novosphingobium sp.]|uniref:M23 family metallopeptidase n=1 Tax=Novosphingobium sp. TaxID=1874826 RepID=UPI003D6C8CBE